MLRVAIAAPKLAPANARRQFIAAGYATSAGAPAGAGATPSDIATAQATQTEIDDNRVWTTSLDVLAAGSGRPVVRAGVLKLLATVPSVTVTKGTHDGRATLILRCTK